MELEEAIKMVEYIKNETKLACEFPKATERDKNRWGKEVQALEVVLHYIKEESIPKAVVEEQIGKINELLPDIDYHDIKDKQEREYYKKEYMKYITVRNYLQGLLNKGE